MKKDRINEIKKGLENEIYTKIKDIDGEKKPNNMSNFRSLESGSDYVSTDFLADILPKKEMNSDTIQIIDKNSVDLELNGEELLQKYDEYIYKDEEKAEVKVEVDVDIKQTRRIDSPDRVDEYREMSYTILENEPNIPKFQTEEHLNRIEKELETVELRYIEENEKELQELKEKEEQLLNNMSKTTSRVKKDNEELINTYPNIDVMDEEVIKRSEITISNDKIGNTFDDYNLENPTLDIDAEDINEMLEEEFEIHKQEDLTDMNQARLELANDFEIEDEIVVSEQKTYTKEEKNQQYEDSQYIFEKYLEEEVEDSDEDDFTDMGINIQAELEQDEDEADIHSLNFEDDEIEDEESFWEDEEEVKNRRYIDVILFIIIIALILYIVYMVMGN